MNTFVKYTLIRAIRTICQTAVAVPITASGSQATVWACDVKGKWK